MIQNLPEKQKTKIRSLHRKFYQTLREELMPILKLFQKIAEEETLPNSFYDGTITLITKPEEDNTKKENYSPISLMSIDAKLLNTILANRIQQHKSSYTIIKWGLFKGYKDSSIYANQSIRNTILTN